MSASSQHVKHVLEVYLERGLAALAALREDRLDDAVHALSLRAAAFHNFRAADALALTAGYDSAKDPEIQTLWIKIREIDEALAPELARAQDETRREALRVKEARQKISGYRSGHQDGTTFVKTA